MKREIVSNEFYVVYKLLSKTLDSSATTSRPSSPHAEINTINSNITSDLYCIVIDIRESIDSLKPILQYKTKRCLSDYNVWLQNMQISNPNETFENSCIVGNGLIQVNVNIVDEFKRICILDIVAPNHEEVANAKKIILVKINRKEVSKKPVRRTTVKQHWGYNGQIQLWEFLLDLLNNERYANYIKWVGDNGEFQLLHPKMVAQLWGEKKNKPNMNYNKLSRALRYYYRGNVIKKMTETHCYRFICDINTLDQYRVQKLNNALAPRRLFKYKFN